MLRTALAKRDIQFLPAAHTAQAVSVRIATAFIVNTPGRTTTHVGVEVLHMTRQHVYHRFTLSPNTFPVAVFMHEVTPILLVVTV